MKSKAKSILASAAVLSLLLISVVPVVAAPQATTGSSTTDTPTTTTTTSNTTNTTTSSAQTAQFVGASTLIQLAQAAQAYADQLVKIAQQNGVNVTLAQSLISQGNTLLTSAQNEVGTNSNQAASDALSSMRDFRMAAQSLQSSVINTILMNNEVTYLQRQIQREQSISSQLQRVVTKACSNSANSSASLCSDANNNLSQANTDLSQASTALSSLGSQANQTTIANVVALMKDAQTHLQLVYTDLKDLANAARDSKGVDYVQTVLLPEVTQLETRVQNANLSSSVTQQAEAQLSQAQTLLNDAVTDFQSGNFTGGVQHAQQAAQLIQQTEQTLRTQELVGLIQNNLDPELAQLQQAAQNANLSSSLAQHVQSQLNQAQTLLNGAVKALQSGDYSSGASQVQQAMQLMAQAMHEIAQGTSHHH